ncbi:MAG: hypothetical protein IPQ18_14465 [Saprospiraceae bacterium]|nr:hypothetical protein [Saprospiraceae bacterium]
MFWDNENSNIGNAKLLNQSCPEFKAIYASRKDLHYLLTSTNESAELPQPNENKILQELFLNRWAAGINADKWKNFFSEIILYLIALKAHWTMLFMNLI